MVLGNEAGDRDFDFGDYRAPISEVLQAPDACGERG